MEIFIGDILSMKKSHPCGCNEFLVTRIGMDFKIVCQKCRHEIFLPRSKCEKSIKKVSRNGERIL